MGEYYSSWQHSSHKNVACVQCHYDPGVAAEMKGKMAGMVQLIKYVSHAYTSKPHAMISNRSCMRGGCHADMEHNETVLLFRGKIRFNHEKHLSSHPRGKELNCVSCHGQMVQGKHISVTETTCLTCHFYGRGEHPVAVGRCETCHTAPDHPVKFVGQTFNHQEFLKDKGKVECVHCHSQVTQGDGSISQARCRTCHLDTKAKIKDQAKFHRIHVSKGHFDCLQCHNEIQHGVHPMTQQILTSGNCKTCHGGERHSLQEKIYAGTALPDMKPTPDVMYAAGVSCDGCHTDAEFVHLGRMTFTSKRSGGKQCADCHADEMYGELLVSWQEDVRQRLKSLQSALQDLEKSCASANVAEDRVAQVKAHLTSAKDRVTYVVRDGSYGAHNNEYVAAILDKAEEEANACRTLLAREAAKK